jgi:molecular chaperone DnaK (HSP70)
MVSGPHYLVGIDLGTSNCAIAFVDPAQGSSAPIHDFPVLQSVRPGETGELLLLPSCIYLPAEHEWPEGAVRLPWGDQTHAVVGEFARWHGVRVPGRLITSAKSWLCHPSVDRSAPILPWAAPGEVRRLSPVNASARFLAHMVRAWNHAHPDAPLERQEVVVTVPASFDEVARALTVSAAREAGLEKFTLLEEPQAAFYDFTAHRRHDLAKALAGVRLVLVVDVGGGTSDFTLVQVMLSPEGPQLRRIAVGEHLILGGDNMDAALARQVEEKMVSQGRKLGAVHWLQLVHAARAAKESLLTDTGPAEYNLSIAGEGSRLVGGAMSARISRQEAGATILDGFFPGCEPIESPRRSARTGLQELGLPFAPDPGITRHLAAFLRAHAAAGFAALGLEPGGAPLPRPDAVLLNGGVFNAPTLVRRLIEVLSSWWPSAPEIPLLGHESLDLAVARGAAVYGLVRHGLGRRISGGAAHALYVGLEKTKTGSARALCVIPRGHEEGESVDLGQRVFQLALGRPVRFLLFSTTSDRLDRAGDVVPVDDNMNLLAPIHALLKGSAGKTGSVPIHLRATLTELGTLELRCVAQDANETWRLEFELRGDGSEPGLAIAESMPATFAEARVWVERIFGGRPRPVSGIKGVPPKDVKQLWTSLERSLGPRDTWRLPVLRELWGALFAGAAKRRRSLEHERVFYQLLGYSLRPGFGYPLDEWRCEQSFNLFSDQVEFHKDKPAWNEFWVLWRRISGGLSEGNHQEIWEQLKPALAVRVPPHAPKSQPKPKGVQPEGLDEMVRLGASLEHLASVEKVQLGDWIGERLREHPTSGPWAWSLGRLGARVPIFGSIHRTLPPEKAQEWATLLLRPELLKLEGVPFALAQLARLTGDRARDVEAGLREQVRSALAGTGQASPSWEHMLTEVVEMDPADRARALGDTLPVGLSLGDA